jgi:hypothetical protein
VALQNKRYNDPLQNLPAELLINVMDYYLLSQPVLDQHYLNKASIGNTFDNPDQVENILIKFYLLKTMRKSLRKNEHVVPYVSPLMAEIYLHEVTVSS